MARWTKWTALAFGVSLGAYHAVMAQTGSLTYEGCTNVTYSENSVGVETLVKWNSQVPGGVTDNTLEEAVKLTVGADAQGNIEVYWVELNGNFKVYFMKDKTVATIMKVPVLFRQGTGNPEQGLMGVVLDPNFKTNNRVYLYHSTKTGNKYAVTRYTLAPDHKSMSNPVVVIDFTVQNKDSCWTP